MGGEDNQVGNRTAKEKGRNIPFPYLPFPLYPLPNLIIFRHYVV